MIEKLRIDVRNLNHITNCYILYDENTKEAVVIDPADKFSIIDKKMKELDLNLKYVFLTHAHIDHTIALSDIIEKYNVKVVAGINENDMLENRVDDCSNRYGLIQKAYSKSDIIFSKTGDKFSIGNIVIEVIETPGHSSGSVCYYVEKENILFTGDTLFANCFGRCDLMSSSIIDMKNSLNMLYNRFKELNPKIYPGHGRDSVNINTALDIVFSNLEEDK